MSFCKKCGAQMSDNSPFCPNCGEYAASSGSSDTLYGGPTFMQVYGRAFAALMGKPIKLWGLSLLGTLLSGICSGLAGVAIPAISICIGMLFTVSLAAIFLKGYNKEEVHVVDLFATFKDWATIKRILTGMGWRALWLFLWALIPVVGPIFLIVKNYEYALVPYILVKKPELNAVQARELSIERTKGHKGQMFLADFMVYIFIGVAMFILSLLGRIPVIGALFSIIAVLLMLCIIILLPLFMGLIHAAFYRELIGDDK